MAIDVDTVYIGPFGIKRPARALSFCVVGIGSRAQTTTRGFATEQSKLFFRETGIAVPNTAPPTSLGREAVDAESVALDARNKLVITLLLVSAFVVILNETLMASPCPHLMRDLSITASAAQWLTTAFMLTMAVVIPITGFLLQRFNTRPVFIAAMTPVQHRHADRRDGTGLRGPVVRPGRAGDAEPRS